MIPYCPLLPLCAVMDTSDNIAMDAMNGPLL